MGGIVGGAPSIPAAPVYTPPAPVPQAPTAVPTMATGNAAAAGDGTSIISSTKRAGAGVVASPGQTSSAVDASQAQQAGVKTLLGS